MGITIGRFSIFDQRPVRAFFTTRVGGVSPKPFDALNLGKSVGDDVSNVDENQRRLFAAMEIEPSALVFGKQIHEDQCVYANSGGVHENTDAIYSDKQGIYLAVSAADCVPILFYESSRKIIGAIHAGWRGTKKEIVKKTIAEVMSRFYLNPENIYAAIGPSIGVNHYEVSGEVAGDFSEEFIIRGSYPKPHLDLSRANENQLRDLGITNIEVSGLCTMANPDLFFSHRGSGGRTGRMWGVIGLV